MTQPDPHRPVSMEKPTAQLAPYATAPLPPAPPPQPQPQPQPFAPSGPPATHLAGPPMPYATTQTVAAPQSNAEIVVAWIVTAITLLYMLPWAVAATRRSTNSILIAVATFFLAWTVLGWFVLLVLSFLGPTVHTMRSTTIVALPAAPSGMWARCPSDPPNVLRWWDGRTWTPATMIG